MRFLPTLYTRVNDKIKKSKRRTYYRQGRLHYSLYAYFPG